MFIILCQVDHVIDGETDQDYDSNGFGDAELPALLDHNGQHADEDNGDTENGPDGKQHVARHDCENDECEDEGDEDTLLRGLHKGFFGDYPSEVETSGELTTLHFIRCIHDVSAHKLLPLFVDGVQVGIRVPLLSNGCSIDLEVSQLIILDRDHSLSSKEGTNWRCNECFELLFEICWGERQLLLVVGDRFLN